MLYNGLRWARLCLVGMLTVQLMLSFDLSADAARKKSSSRSRSSARRSSQSAKHKTPKIVGDNVSLRSGPGEKSQRLTLTDVGTRVKVLNRRSGWLQVRLPNGKEGWMRGDFVANAGSSGRSSSQSSSSSRRSSSEKQTASRRSTTKNVSTTKQVAASNKKGASSQSATPKPPAQTSAKSVAANANPVVPDRRGKRMHRAEPVPPLGVAATPVTLPENPVATPDSATTDRTDEKATAPVEITEKPADKPEAAEDRARATNDSPKEKASAPRKDMVRTAYAYRGTPYRFGGMSTRGFDCSGFMCYLFRQKGITLPRTAAQQARSGKKVSRAELQEGDLVFFHTTRRGISHVGMYVGNGDFIHASSRGSVRVDTLDSGYYKERMRGARRYTK